MIGNSHFHQACKSVSGLRWDVFCTNELSGELMNSSMQQLRSRPQTFLVNDKSIGRTSSPQAVLFYNLSSIFTIGCNIIIIMNLILM